MVIIVDDDDVIILLLNIIIIFIDCIILDFLHGLVMDIAGMIVWVL